MSVSFATSMRLPRRYSHSSLLPPWRNPLPLCLIMLSPHTRSHPDLSPSSPLMPRSPGLGRV
eukprot:764308-Hanusia_phi.AAC.7